MQVTLGDTEMKPFLHQREGSAHHHLLLQTAGKEKGTETGAGKLYQKKAARKKLAIHFLFKSTSQNADKHLRCYVAEVRGVFGYFSFKYPFPRIVFALCLFVFCPFSVFLPPAVNVSAPAFAFSLFTLVCSGPAHTQSSGCYSDYWVGQLALGAAGFSHRQGKKNFFSVTCMHGLYLTQSRGILTSFQVWELSLTAACAYI